MESRHRQSCVIAIAALTAVLTATHESRAIPRIVSLGSGTPISVTNKISGTTYIGGSGITSTQAARWLVSGTSLTATEIGGVGGGFTSADGEYVTGLFVNEPGPNQVFGYTATGVTPAHNSTPTLSLSTFPRPGTNERTGYRWNATGNTWSILGGPNGMAGPLAQNVGLPVVPSLAAFGSSSSGGSSGNFISPNAISATGRFVVGLGYVCVYNNAGSAISDNSFRWRPWIWDADANGGAGGFTILPTPFKTTSGQTSLRRTGNAYAVSADGQIIVGAQEHNVGTSASANPDGGRLVVWRWNAGTSSYDMTFLPNGVNGSGFPYTYSTTPSGVAMNAAGTIIVGRAISDSGSTFIGKWVWNAGTSSWDAPIVIGADLAMPASWLPFAVTSCGVPPNVGSSLAMSDDGNIVVGAVTYSTCGSFMAGGFIWHESDGAIKDWYDFLVEEGSTDALMNYGPIGDLDDPNRGLPRLGFPTAISPDGNEIVGIQGGNQIIPGAVPTYVDLTGGTACSEAVITQNPAEFYNLTRCSSLGIILNAKAAGTLPINYQWRKSGVNMTDGLTGHGSIISGSNDAQLRIMQPKLGDLGEYDCVITGSCGPTVITTSCTVQIDPSVAIPTNDTCDTAAEMTGTLPITVTFNPCNAWVDDGDSPCPNGIGDLWYSFTPPSTAQYRFETCDSTITTSPNSANYDTVLRVHDVCGGTTLGCNDDYETGATRNCSATRSRVARVTLQAGVPVLVRVAGKTTLAANGFLKVSLAPPIVANDDCFDPAVAVDGANTFDLTEANNDSFVTCNGNLGRDVWFVYTATQTGLLTLSTCDSTTNLDTVVTVFDACGGNELGCNDTASPAGSGCSSSRAILRDVSVDQGATYYIRVSAGTIGTMGTNAAAIGGKLTLSLTALSIVDQPSDVDICAGSSTEFSVTASGAVNYQWRHDGMPLSESADISGSTAATLHVMNASLEDEGAYDCRVSNGNGLVWVVSDIANLTILDSCLNGDTNCDGMVGPDDVAAFVSALLNAPSLPTCTIKNADVNGDGNVDGDDIQLFVTLISP